MPCLLTELETRFNCGLCRDFEPIVAGMENFSSGGITRAKANKKHRIRDFAPMLDIRLQIT
jgi:hypothetical protein